MVLRVSTLPNGLRVATDTMPDAQSVLFGVWVGVGSRHEPAGFNGIAHLVEHMMFKGTRKRSAFDLSSAIEARGGSMNAYTSREETAYYAHVLPEDTILAADIISDMLKNSVFDPQELERERQVVLQEIGRDQDTPEDHISDLLLKVSYPRQKIGRPILGMSDGVLKIGRKDLKDYVKQHYHARNMVVVASGQVDHDAVVRLAQRFFGRLKGGAMPKIGQAKCQHGHLYQTKDSEQLHIMLGFSGPSVMSKDSYKASVLGVVLGGTSSSRLFQKVREEKGLAYAVSTHHMTFQDTGLFNFYAGTDPARAGELMRIVAREFVKAPKNIKKDEVDLAKAQIRASLLMGQESVVRRAESLGSQMIVFGKPVPVAKRLERLSKITHTDVQSIAGVLFRKKPVLVALGPYESMESYADFVTRLKA